MSKSSITLSLSKRDKTFVVIGACIFMFFMAGNGTALAISQKYLLENLNGLHFFSFATILITLGTSIMTPIGGSLGIIVGRKKLLIVSGVLAFVTTIAVVYSTNIYVYLFFIIANGLAKGAFTATCYILMSLVNEQKDIPKAMGLLASSVSAGTLFASLFSGIFNDMGQTGLGIIIISATVIIGIIFIFIGLPSTDANTDVNIDTVGIMLLVVALSAFVLSFNFGTTLGWTNPLILLGFAVLIVFTFLLYKYESKIEQAGGSPIIKMSLFKNGEFVALLVIGVTLYFYQVVMTNYGTLAAIDVLGVSATVAGTLTIPRTIITLILPTMAGIWVTKKHSNSWLAMSLASAILIAAFGMLIPISPTMSITMFFIAFSLTGVTESLRAVSTLPAAQKTLSPEQLADGTSLVSFINTLAPVLSATISGALFNAAADTVSGMRNIFIATIAVSVLGLVLVLFFVRPRQEKRFQDESK